MVKGLECQARAMLSKPSSWLEHLRYASRKAARLDGYY